MKEIEFNLIKEPWIKVRTPTLNIETVSLEQALFCAHMYTGLAGELSTQDVAILRLLLAVLHTVFSRVDENGEDAPIQKANHALHRWKNLWEKGRFPEKPLRDYLDRWFDRFWLFHPERPFYQVEGAVGTNGRVAKLNGELSQGENKRRLFPICSGAAWDRMPYPEAARWLLYLNSFADIAVAPDKRKNLDVGWLGQLSLVTAVGNTLFETLMLNLVFLNEGRKTWGNAAPAWELNQVRTGDRTEVPIPDNQAELLTLQSRRILLQREEDMVVGYVVSGGDYFSGSNAFSEQMTMWARNKEGDYYPYKAKHPKQIWREFSSLAIQRSDEDRRPGVVQWQQTISKSILRADWMARFQIDTLYYDSKRSMVDDIASDALTFHLSLLTDVGTIWRKLIQKEIQRCERFADAVGKLATNLEKAAGHVERDGKGNLVPWYSMATADKAKEDYYYQIDVPFRAWLEKPDPDQDDTQRETLRREWADTAKRTALRLGEELALRAGDTALVGRFIQEGKEKKHYSTPEAIRDFRIELNSISKKEG